MNEVIKSEIGAVFIPVSDIEASRDWYCRLLNQPVHGEILFGHLFVIPMQSGPALVLDSKNFTGPQNSKPLFHFNSDSIETAHAHLLAIGAKDTSQIQEGGFVTFKDPDHNLLMIADVPPAEPYKAKAVEAV
ncbi:hypothetical protein GCM10007094_08490 [Pseudovibrio japonicus]|uniref:Glyoxalase/fosfomycin resistance/dioxygenase domain-containing protein n=1 Tax=Pseudovibrio japonicus TaxID=366534 RepID=A0ABQ3E2F1_9HYPH|nr:VOC family protein [Pseudovibrio japonicus]GHB22612.1 hypothetical protein GCM10007094_08490 [Pseudovibrio japonicus]